MWDSLKVALIEGQQCEVIGKRGRGDEEIEVRNHCPVTSKMSARTREALSDNIIYSENAIRAYEVFECNKL
jgi:hypothetical protein